MFLGTAVMDSNRFKLFDSPNIFSGKFSCIVYSPKIRFNNNTFRIFSIFSEQIWILLLLSYICLIAINSFKQNIEIISKLFVDYFGLFLNNG